MMEGVVLRGRGGLYTVLCEGGEHTLRAMKKLRRDSNLLAVGDNVLFTPGEGDEHGWITEILPRKNACARPPVANIGLMALVIAPEPAPDLLLVDKMLVAAQRQAIPTAIICNKDDLDGALYAQISREYARSGAAVFRASALRGEGLPELHEAMAGKLACFAGQSGVGKSTLLGALTGLQLQVGDISSRISRGKHTTRHVELLVAGDLRVLDTPGFSLLDDMEVDDPVTLRECYPEFAPYGLHCRFSPCYHQSEPGCKVLEALELGDIDRARVDRYHLLLQKARQAWKERYD